MDYYKVELNIPGKYALVSRDKADIVRPYSWCYDKSNGYVVTTKQGRKISMHRLLLDPGDDIVDHIDHNKLDNRNENLRICSHFENTKNKNRCTNEYTGVRKAKTKTPRWYAYIKYDYVQYYLGSFPTAKKAAQAYDSKAIEWFGEYASVNFPRRERKRGKCLGLINRPQKEKASDCSSKYKGVTLAGPNRWTASYYNKDTKKTVYIGRYPSEIEAANAVNDYSETIIGIRPNKVQNKRRRYKITVTRVS